MQQQVPDQSAQLPQHSAHILASRVKLVEQQQRCLGVPGQDALQQLGSLKIARQAQSLQHGPAVHSPARGGALVQQAQSVPQCAVSQTAQQLRTVGSKANALLRVHVFQPPGV